MTVSRYSPSWRRWLQRHCKFLFSVCPGRNYHWRWELICHCVDGNETEEGPSVWQSRTRTASGSA